MSGSNRKSYHRRGKHDFGGRYVRLAEHLLASKAWQSLDGNTRALYIEVVRRYRGPNSNNGTLSFSVREAASALRIGRSTAQRCFEALVDRGFLQVGRRSGFTVKGRIATEWLATEFPDDRSNQTTLATKDFMKWRPESSEHSPVSDTHSPATDPPLALRRDRVA